MRAACHLVRLFLATGLTTLCLPPSPAQITLNGQIVDSATDHLLSARIYIQSEEKNWFFARSADPQGSAVEYRKRRSEISFEMHTTLSAHPFQADLPAGEYQITVERGKEYLPFSTRVQLKNEPVSLTIRLRRWIDMNQHGWYSGETHVHRDLRELPNAMLAEDLNVALPLTYWVTKAFTPPSQGDKNSPPVRPELITIDPLHVIYPMNTEYEIFTVDGNRHTLGAVFALNHQRVLPQGAPRYCQMLWMG